jgi:uncharacterized protein YecE (DUF72 family)
MCVDVRTPTVGAAVTNSLFDDTDRPELASQLAPILRDWANGGVFIGTSSWKYPGWLGQIYTESHYFTRGKFSNAKFEASCLTEYAETFPVVGGDFSFYQFPSAESWAKTFAGVPPGFAFGLKVPETVTVNIWPGHARYGQRAGLPNEGFLDASLFKTAFLDALEPHREKVGVQIFEFGTFSKKDFPTPADFLLRLDAFLRSLPEGWRYAVEIRNKDYLGPDYFSVLSRHNVAHVFNAWTRMPPLTEQIAMPGSFTADFTVVRALLSKGRSYEKAVSLFEPYERIQEPDPSTRVAIREIVEHCKREKKRAYAFVNNRLEGSAPQTIRAVVSDNPSA